MTTLTTLLDILGCIIVRLCQPSGIKKAEQGFILGKIVAVRAHGARLKTIANISG